VLRSCYNISEFSDDPACILRLGLSPARAPVSLADGTRVRTGQPGDRGGQGCQGVAAWRDAALRPAAGTGQPEIRGFNRRLEPGTQQ
jgi:hypothetical protein